MCREIRYKKILVFYLFQLNRSRRDNSRASEDFSPWPAVSAQSENR